MNHTLRNIFCLFCLLMLYSGLRAGTNKYNVANIPDHLKENAIAVIREQHTRLEVSGPRNARFTERKVITILDRRAEGHADLVVFHDDFRKIRKYSGTIYDANGKKIRDLKKDEFTDQSATSSFSLYEDNRVLYTDIYRSQFPFTVAFEYEVDYRDGYFLQGWYPQTSTEMSVEQASHTLILPRGWPFRHRVVNHDHLQTSINEDGNEMALSWSLDNIPAVKPEPYMPPLLELVPHVLIGSSDFHYGGYSGNMDTWEAFGAFFAQLNQGRQNLPEATRQKVRELIAGTHDVREKTRIVYEYMQSRTRYVSIQLGIGGYQPFDAATVDRTGYGDCKALVNFTQALLQEAGIPSFYAIIHHGSRNPGVLKDFPTNPFNHVILAVPVDQDTLWLECTSNIIPMGYIGSDNADRPVLLVTPEGGKLTRTPRYDHPANQKETSVQATLEANGNIEFAYTSRYKGLRFGERLGLSIQGSGQQKKYLQQNLGVNNPEILELSFDQQKTEIPVLEETLRIKTSQYISKAGNRLLFIPNIISRLQSVPSIIADRHHPLKIEDSGMNSDTVTWKIPEGYQIVHIPEEVTLDNPFGYYHARYLQEGPHLRYERTLFFKEGLHAAEKYNEYVEFVREIYQSDNNQVIIGK